MRAKYSDVAETIEARIRSRAYRDRLPSTRLLAQEFAVTLQTISRALKMLAERNLVTSSPNGMLIKVSGIDESAAMANNVVGIVSEADITERNIMATPLLKEIREMLRPAGFRALFMQLLNEELAADEEFWSSLGVGGYIFLSCTVEVAAIIRRRNIPAISLCWTPIEWEMTSLAFDNLNTIGQLFQTLVATGYRRIALLWPYNRVIGNYLQEEIAMHWRSLIARYNPGQPDYYWDQPEDHQDPLARRLAIDDYVLRQASRLMEFPEPPDAVINFYWLQDRVIRLFAGQGMIHGRNFALVMPYLDYDPHPEVTLIERPGNYNEYAGLVVDYYRMLVNNPALPAIRGSLHYPLQFRTPLPPCNH